MNSRQNLSRKKGSYRDSNDLLHSKYQTTLNKQYQKQTGIQQSFDFYSNFINKNDSSILFQWNDIKKHSDTNIIESFSYSFIYFEKYLDHCLNTWHCSNRVDSSKPEPERVSCDGLK